MLLQCRDATRALASDEMEGAPWRRRLAVRLHLLLCHHCRRYERQLRAVGNLAREAILASDSAGEGVGGGAGRRDDLTALEAEILGAAGASPPPTSSSPGEEGPA